jgi:hypothetical protein
MIHLRWVIPILLMSFRSERSLPLVRPERVNPEPLGLSGSTEPFGLERLRVERLAEVSGRRQALRS